MLERLKSRKGVLLPVAIVAMLMAGVATFYGTQTLLDRQALNTDINMTAYSRREADNAIAYALWAANTPSTVHPDGKRGTSFTNGTLQDITNIDGGSTETIEGYPIKRLVKFSGGVLIAYGRVFNKSDVMIAETMATMTVDPAQNPIRVNKDTLVYSPAS